MLIGLGFFCFGCDQKSEVKTISQEMALVITQETAEAKALFALHQGVLAQCLETKVVLPCDSEGWVTCVDNAWVVKYELEDSCPVKSDGRLGAHFLVDGTSGKIISRYPEIEYFKDPQFCRDNNDCLCAQSSPTSRKRAQCLNFIHAPFADTSINACDQCICKKNTCGRP